MEKVELEKVMRIFVNNCFKESKEYQEIKIKLGIDDEKGNKVCDSTESQISIEESKELHYLKKIEYVENKCDELLLLQNQIIEFFKEEKKMFLESIKQYLKQLLEDECREKIELEKKHHNEIVGNLNSSIDLLKIEKDRLEKEKENEVQKRTDLEKSLQDVKNQYAVFEDILAVWKCIESMNSDNRYYINSLCGGSDILAIISLGRDENKIDQLWYYLKDFAVKEENDREEVNRLNNYFEFCINLSNATRPENEQFVLSEIAIGSEFDLNKSIRTSYSKQIGAVKETVVKRVDIDDRIKYKAIVCVE